VIGHRNADPALAAKPFNPRHAGETVGVMRVNVSIDEQFRLPGWFAKHVLKSGTGFRRHALFWTAST
jgi:hypothetical protein